MKSRQILIYMFGLLLTSLFPRIVHSDESSQSVGDNNKCPVQIINSVNSNIDLSCPNLGRAATIDNNAVLLLKEVKDPNQPGTSISDYSNHLGLVESGAKVKIIAETTPDIVFHKFTRIEILEGGLKGQVGWVFSNRIQISNVAE